MNIKFIAVVLIAQTFFCQVVFAQTRGAANIKVKNNKGKTVEIKLYDASYALVIGNGKYTSGWDTLPGVGTDVAAVKKVLENQGFNVETAENLASRDFSNRILQFIDDYGYQPNNRLLIYYAGHGHTLKSTGDGRDLGYVVPIDAPDPKKDEIGFKRKAIPMDDILNFAKKIQSKHALFLFDSCFSGRLVTRNAIAVPPIIQESVAYPVRQFITAGAANQSVPDESIFRRSFVRAFEGEADRNSDGYITGTELAEYLKEKVTNYSNRKQTPQYGKINDIELDKGDFVFIVPKISAELPNNATNTLRDNEQVERGFWESVKNSTEVEDFKLYIEKYPNGIYKNTADLKIKQLKKEIKNGAVAIKIERTECWCDNKTGQNSLRIDVSNPNLSQESFAAKVFVNGKDITSKISNQLGTIINLSGTLAELNLVEGKNQVVVSKDGVRSEPSYWERNTEKPSLEISNISCMCGQYVTFTVPSRLLVFGSQWDGRSNLKVLVNGKDVSKYIDSQTENTVVVVASIKELNLIDGINQVVVILDGEKSNTYTFKQAFRQ